MILTDGTHIVSTLSAEELHAFARSIGLKRAWYQPQNRHPHYDMLSTRVKARAYALGAVRVTTKELLQRAWWAQGG